MSYEISVLVVGQKEPAKLPFSTDILVENESNPFFGRYGKIWPFSMQTKGILYSLGRCDPEWDDDPDRIITFSAFSICDSDFEHPLPKIPHTEWIPKRIREDLTPLLIYEKDIAELKKILTFLLHSSPKKLMMFYTRYQCHDKEIICGAIKRDKFFKLLEAGKLCFNVCYIVSE